MSLPSKEDFDLPSAQRRDGSIYNYASSTADGATVPLYFENRIPALRLVNPTFSEDLTDLIEAADLDADQERKLARRLGQQYELITRDDRLDTVAEDIVEQFLGRGVAVAWSKKHGDEYRAALQERGKSKLGRKARPRGTVEKAVVSEPATELASATLR
jgi:type I restriction enzyme, R subunit